MIASHTPFSTDHLEVLALQEQEANFIPFHPSLNLPSSGLFEEKLVLSPSIINPSLTQEEIAKMS